MTYISDLSEVDGALKEALSNMVVRDGDKILPVHVTFSTPDLDMRDEKPYPVFAIQRSSPQRDDLRFGDMYTPVTIVKEYDENGKPKEVVEVPPPIPYVINYQVRLRFNKQSYGSEIGTKMLRRFPRGRTLTIKGVEYPLTMGASTLWGTQYKDFGLVKDGKRRFNELFTFAVRVWINSYDEEDFENIAKTFKTVQTIGVNVGMIDGNKREEDFYGERDSKD